MGIATGAGGAWVGATGMSGKLGIGIGAKAGLGK
jgi:hypothetical protein